MTEEIKEHTTDKNEALIPVDQQKKSLRASVWDGCFYSGMAGTGESYFVLLLEALKATNIQVAWFVAIPHLCVAFVQFFSIYIIERVRKRRRIMVTGASMQAVMLGGIFLLLVFKIADPFKLMLVASIYYASNGIAIPAWNSLMGDITQGIDRGKYFGSRNGLCQIVLFAAFLVAGAILQRYDALEIPLMGFTIIMLLSMLSRIVSAIFLRQHYDVAYEKIEGAYFSFWEFITRAKQSNFAKFTFLVAAMSFSVMISGPFFAIYLRRELGMPYFYYAVTMGILVIMQYLSMRFWGAFADKYGNRIVLKITGLLLPLLPFMWILLNDYKHWLIVFIVFIGGIAWGGWALSSGNFIFDAVSSEKRARCTGYMFFFNSIGMALGAILGGYLTKIAPSGVGFGDFRLEFFTEIQFAFLMSGILRLIVIAVFLPFVKEVRKVDKPNAREVIMLFTHVRPLSGANYEPLSDRDEDKSD